MKIPTHPTLIRARLDGRVGELAAKRPVLAASLVSIARQCGRKNCRCQRGFKHVSRYLTFKVSGKTRTVYVPVDMVEEVQSWVEEHRRLKRLVKESSDLAVALIRSHVQEKRRKKGRP